MSAVLMRWARLRYGAREGCTALVPDSRAPAAERYNPSKAHEEHRALAAASSAHRALEAISVRVFGSAGRLCVTGFVPTGTTRTANES